MSLLCGLLLLLAPLPVLAADLPGWILDAGNAETDEKIAAILRQARDRSDLSAETRTELDAFLKFIDRWQHHDNLKWFRSKVERERRYDFAMRDDSPLRPIADIYEARMMTWVMLASGKIWNNPATRREWGEELRIKLERLATRFPGNDLIAMYLGTPFPRAAALPPVPGAPAWAVQQREAIELQREIVHWLIDHRQQPSGAYGGGWGDDCEMWRFWLPVLLAFEDPKIVAAQEKLSRGLLGQEHMLGGYTSIMSDAEHTGEDSADTITPMIHLQPQSAEWNRRALRIFELARTQWTGVNKRGFLQFKSCYFTAKDIDLTPERAAASMYEHRTLQPPLLLWQRTRDAQLGSFFIPWLDGWHAASMLAARGKPAGIIPTAFRWPDGLPGGAPPEWWEPDLTPGDPLYFWPSAMTMMTQNFVLGWNITKDEKYLEPLRAMANARRAYLAQPVPEPEAGSLRWCGRNMTGLQEALAKYRLLSGSGEFDDLLSTGSNAYLRFLLEGDASGLEAALQNHAAALRDYFPGYTSEVRITDRTMRFPWLFTRPALFAEPLENAHEPDTQLVFSTLTGEPGDGMYFPLTAVRWRTEPRDFAALVRQTGASQFEASVFHFGAEPRRFDAEFFLLQPGKYRCSLAAENEHVITTTIEITRENNRIPLEIPSRRLCSLRILPL